MSCVVCRVSCRVVLCCDVRVLSCIVCRVVGRVLCFVSCVVWIINVKTLRSELLICDIIKSKTLRF